MSIKKNNSTKTIFSESISVESTISRNTKVSKISNIPALQNIGKKINKVVIQDKIGDISPELINTPKISTITFIGEVNNKEAKKRWISQRLGISKQNIFNLRNSLLPNITINTDFVAYNNGELNYQFEVTTLGQSNDIATVKNNQFIPYNDRLSEKFSSKKFIELNQKNISYPNLTNGNENFVNFKNPDAVEGTLGGPERNGTIDVFGTLTTLINTNPSDIHVLGIRGNFGVIDQEISQYDRSRGSSIIDNKYELKQSKYVFFEDSQEMHLSSPVGNIKKSEEGFISTSKYITSPFEEKIINENKYEILTSVKSRLLLSSSNSNMSEIGTRFKSATSGFTLDPFCTSTITQNNLGTDSIAFDGLLRG